MSSDKPDRAVESDEVRERFRKLEELRKRQPEAFPNDFSVSATSLDFAARYGQITDLGLSSEKSLALPKESIAGRVVAKRMMGKAAFCQLRDRAGDIQIYVRKDRLGDEAFENFKTVDLGDFLGVCGTAFRTKTAELTVDCESVRLLVKALRPLPEKWHGLQDVETRYRQRYLDLISNEQSRRIFQLRSRTVHFIRNYLIERDFLEVETPMMHLIPGGAAARPFVTHHNALDLDLYLRIAPELHLKRLVVGGFERVFEINRNFRNEGISTQHNPEFTMLEFYQAYATYEDLIETTEDLVTRLVESLHQGKQEIPYQGQTLSFRRPWKRIPMVDAVREHLASRSEASLRDLAGGDFNDPERLARIAEAAGHPFDPRLDLGQRQAHLFEELVEKTLIQPTFVTHYPVSVSPLSRRNARNPQIVDRFELIIAGREIANAFSELNDPIDQRQRFEDQAKKRTAGDEEAMFLDEDYIRALEHGMPPTAGEGIGIDRLVMLLTDSPSIREVILFPVLRPDVQARSS